MFSSIKSNVHCYCRLRREEGPSSTLEAVGTDLVRLKNRLTQANSSFFFDRVYISKSSQYDLFQEFEPLLNDILNGSRATIFNFGESSSGKTFTQYGNPSNHGLVHRLMEKLTDQSMRIVCRLKLSMVEIIGNDVFDLYSPSYKRLRLLNGNPDFSLLTYLEVATPMDMLSNLEQGLKSRTLAHSQCDRNNNSHLVVSYIVEVQERKEIVKKGALTFVDLAGSEHINYSIPQNPVQTTLQALSAVIRSFDARDPVISTGQENCSLLKLLNDSLQCNHQLIMIYNVDPSADHLQETQKTLQFHHDSRKEYNYVHLIQFLEKENSQLMQLVSTLKLENGVYTRQGTTVGSSNVIARLSVNSSGTAASPGVSLGLLKAHFQSNPKSPSNVPLRINSIDRINPITQTFVPHGSNRRGTSVSIPSLIPKSPLKGSHGSSGLGPLTTSEIKSVLGYAPLSSRKMKFEETIPENEPISIHSARAAAPSSKGAFSNLHTGVGGGNRGTSSSSGVKRLVKGKLAAKKSTPSRLTGGSAMPSSGRTIVKSSNSSQGIGGGGSSMKSGIVKRFPAGGGGGGGPGSLSTGVRRVAQPRPGYMPYVYQE